ncbi:MAG TPA: hypothetical protein VG892_09070 [Terriglobales bacterium]|nr:hypothetical protein [Terriglobales bacterium]
MGSSLRAAFLLSQHPAINHAFLLREIRQMRALGFEIHTISIRAAIVRPKTSLPKSATNSYKPFTSSPSVWQLMKVCSYREWSKIELAYLGLDPTAFRPRPFRPVPAPKAESVILSIV